MMELLAAWRTRILIGVAIALLIAAFAAGWKIAAWRASGKIAAAATAQQACSDQNVILNDRLSQQNAAADALAAAATAAAQKGAQTRAAAAKASQAYRTRIVRLTAEIASPGAQRKTCDDAIAEWRVEARK